MAMSKQEFLAYSGIQIQTLEFWVTQRWLIPDEASGAASFSEGDAARARLIRDLKNDFGVNDEGIDLILHLTDQLHGLRAALAQLPGHIREP